MAPTGETRARFGTTNWTLLEALNDEVHPRRERALELLSERYWPAIYASFRRLGKSREEAADLTQGFFADVILGRRLFEHADAERGRLRSLLLVAVKRYAISAHRKQRGAKAGRELPLAELGREEAFLGSDSEMNVDQIFERRWALSLLEEALARCEQSLRAEGLGEHWLAFERRAVRPAITTIARPSLAELAERSSFPSAAHVASALKVVRKRLDLMLREVASETALDNAAREAEYRSLLDTLAPATT